MPKNHFPSKCGDINVHSTEGVEDEGEKDSVQEENKHVQRNRPSLRYASYRWIDMPFSCSHMKREQCKEMVLPVSVVIWLTR